LTKGKVRPYVTFQSMHSYCFAPWCWFAFTEKHYLGRDSAGIPIINSAEGRGVVDLYGAATQFFGTPTWITLGAALLISTTAFIVMLLYVRAVDPKSKPGKTMPHPGPVVQGGTPPLLQLPTGPLEIQTEKPGVPRRLPPPRSPTFQHAKTGFRRAACFYTLGGSVAAATSAICPWDCRTVVHQLGPDDASVDLFHQRHGPLYASRRLVGRAFEAGIRGRYLSRRSSVSRYQLPSPGSGWCGSPAAIDA
jgi:hypothetical protein